MTAADLEAMFVELLDALANVHPDDLPGDLAEIAELLDGANVRSFGAAGVLTRDAGVELTLRRSGATVPEATFQITIVEA